jgi:hypothetical protein
MKNFGWLLCLLLLVAGCSTPQHIRKSNYYKYDWGISGAVTDQIPEASKHHPIFADDKSFVEGPANYKRNANYFLFGLFPSKQEIKLSEACGDKPFRQAYADHSLWQATSSLLTLGIYTPRIIQVWCGDETASN